MAQPTTSTTTRNNDLGASLQEFDLEMDAMGFIANRVFPTIDVAKQSGTFGKVPLDQLLQSRSTKRAPGSGYARGDWVFETATYTCEEHGAEEPVDDREREMWSEFVNSELIATQRAYSAVLRNAEQRVADAVFNATTWTSHTTAITNEWDDATNATPLVDVEAAVQSIYDASGLWANTLIINRKVFRNLRNSDAMIARIESSGAGFPTRASDITVAQMAAAFDLDNIIVAGASKNTANEGQAATPAQIWSDEYAMVCRIASGADFREPCIGRTFHWVEDGSLIGGQVETYREEAVRSDIVRVRHDVDEVVLYVEAGHLLSNATT